MFSERSGLIAALRRARPRRGVRAPAAVTAKVSIRPAAATDAEAICGFLHRELNRAILPPQWQALFTLPWTSAPDYGHLMEADGQIVGYVGGIVSEREIAGRGEIVCNLTSWCVSAGYRAGLAPISLLMPYLRRKDQTLTSLTPGKTATPIFKRLGFQVLDEGKIISPPFCDPRTILARGRILSDVDAIRNRLAADHRLLLDHHAPLGCGMFLVVRPQGYAFLIVKRRVKMGIPLSEVLLCTDAGLAAPLLERLKLRILLCQRTVALVADRRIFGAHQPHGLAIARQTLFRSERVAPDSLDNLYSEIAILPI